jgi:hypothetical protein
MQFSDPRIHPYLPSLQPNWVSSLKRSLYHYRDNVEYGSFAALDEFNWYDGSKPRFSHPYALYSPGHAELDPDKARVVDKLLFERDRDRTFLLTDSGGFQVGTGAWPIEQTSKYVTKVLRWQEAIADLAVILEVPTWMKVNGSFIEFEQAVDLTNRNLKAYAEQATGKVKFLNTLHGMTYDEGRRWFDATRWFNDEGHAVGWCFSSIFSLNLYEALRMLAYMIEQEHYPQYLHFLGQGTAQSAIVASMMRRTVPRAYPEHVKQARSGNALNVTVDASSEFQTTGRYMSIYERVVEAVGGKTSVSPFSIKTAKFEGEDRSRFPADRTYPDVEGPILGKYSKGVVFGDILAPLNSQTKSSNNLDDVSLAILIAHNLWVKLDAIERMSQLESALRRIHYGMEEAATYELADILSRLLHSSTNKGQVSDLGNDLVACTVGLWRAFKDAPNNNQTRAEVLEQFKSSAQSAFGVRSI